MQGIEFTSRLPRHKRHALERILFFNGCQDRFARGIVDVIDRYGPPEIVDDEAGLSVRVGNLPDVQCLFAVETLTARPVGVAVYNRADLEHVTVLHLGMSEDYCTGGINDDVGLLLRLMGEVRRLPPHERRTPARSAVRRAASARRVGLNRWGPTRARSPAPIKSSTIAFTAAICGPALVA